MDRFPGAHGSQTSHNDDFLEEPLHTAGIHVGERDGSVDVSIAAADEGGISVVHRQTLPVRNVRKAARILSGILRRFRPVGAAMPGEIWDPESSHESHQGRGYARARGAVLAMLAKTGVPLEIKDPETFVDWAPVEISRDLATKSAEAVMAMESHLDPVVMGVALSPGGISLVALRMEGNEAHVVPDSWTRIGSEGDDVEETARRIGSALPPWIEAQRVSVAAVAPGPRRTERAMEGTQSAVERIVQDAREKILEDPDKRTFRNLAQLRGAVEAILETSRLEILRPDHETLLMQAREHGVETQSPHALDNEAEILGRIAAAEISAPSLPEPSLDPEFGEAKDVPGPKAFQTQSPPSQRAIALGD